jgi:hypothetical protein
MLQVETHANSSLSPCKMSADCAKEAALEHDSSLDVAHKLGTIVSWCVMVFRKSGTYPSRALLHVSVVGLRNRTVLERFRNEARLPASSQHLSTAANVFAQGFNGEASDLFQSRAPHDVP